MQDVTQELEKLKLQIKALPREASADIEELEERLEFTQLQYKERIVMKEKIRKLNPKGEVHKH